MTKKKENPKPRGNRKKVRPSGAFGIADAVDAAIMQANPTLPEEKSRGYLRMLAMWNYTTDLARCSVKDLSMHPLFSGIPYETLETWSKADKWRDKREETLTKWSNHLTDTIGSKLVQQRLEEIGKLREVKTRVLERLIITHKFEALVTQEALNDAAIAAEEHEKRKAAAKKAGRPEPDAPRPAKTSHLCKHCGRMDIGHDDPFWGVKGDALVNAYAKLVELEFEIAERVMGVLGVQSGAQNVATTGNRDDDVLTQTITKEEALAAAHAVIRQRRQAALGPANVPPT